MARERDDGGLGSRALATGSGDRFVQRQRPGGIAGSGPLRQTLEDLARSLNVVFLGQIPDSELIDCYHAAGGDCKIQIAVRRSGPFFW
jgi:hypothetical protein